MSVPRPGSFRRPVAPSSAPSGAGRALLRLGGAHRPAGWFLFEHPREVLATRDLGRVRALLERAEQAAATGSWVVGYLTYEAAPAFDAALVTHPAGPLPLLWLGIFDRPRALGSSLPSRNASFALSPWRPSLGETSYGSAVRAILAAIARGETYQVNYTLRLRARFEGDPLAFFERLDRTQTSPYAAYVEDGRHAVCSVSPELFFRLHEGRLETRPMKGTARRGLGAAADRRQLAWLAGSQKNRAENLMIVDMVRNDLGRIARPGSVRVPHLFEVEQYSSLFQMTSTVTAQTDAGPGEVLAALFPSASVTGAPKVSTCRWIRRLEIEPRGVYTGAVGYLEPGGRDARFNVAIRTVHIDQQRGLATYGTGGGIVWDSSPREELAECRVKASVLTASEPSFDLLETLLWRPHAGFFLLDRHLHRLTESARYFSFPLDLDEARTRLLAFDAPTRSRVRLTLDRKGRLGLEAEPLAPRPAPCRLALADEPIDARDPLLYHKTTRRDVYERARLGHLEVDDVLLWNRAGEVTEATIANLVLRRGEALVTPPVRCGLLAGTYRAELLERGRIREGLVTRETLREADALYLISSVRGWTPALLLERSTARPAGRETRRPGPRSRIRED